MGEVEGYRACVKCTQNCFHMHRKGDLIAPSSFFKVLLGDFCEGLRIPPAFVERLKYEVNENALLEGPTGEIWLVEIRKRGTEMAFENGWQNFVSDHSLAQGDFLVFTYVGESYFVVQIFGRTCCEKRYAFTVRKPGPCSVNGRTEKKQNNSKDSTIAKISNCASEKTCIYATAIRNRGSQVQRLQTAPGTAIIKSRIMQTDNTRKRKTYEDDLINLELSTTNSLSHGKEVGCSLAKPIVLDTEGASDGEVYPTGGLMMSLTEACASQSHVFNQDNHLRDVVPHVKKRKIATQKCQGTKDGVNGHYSTHYISSRRNVTEEEREKALQAAKSFWSNRPFTLMIMKQSQVYRGFWLGMPRDFARSYLPRERTEVTLIGPSEKKWKVLYLGNRSNGGLSGGWKKFAIDNSLEEGDVCIFELENDKNYTLKVHIFRVVEDCTPLKLVRVRLNKEDDNVRNVTAKKHSRKNTRDSRKVKSICNSSSSLVHNGLPVPLSIIIPKTEICT